MADKKMIVEMTPETFDDIYKTYRQIVLTRQFVTFVELESIIKQQQAPPEVNEKDISTTTN